MQENALGATELNQKSKTEAELNQALQELFEVKRKIETLDLPKDYTPVSISKYKSIKLTDKLQDSDGIIEDDVYVIELEKENEERQQQLYAYRNDELVLLATIDEKNDLLLSEQEKERYAQITREGELDTPYKLDQNQLEEKKELEMSLEEEKQPEEKDDKSIKGKEAQIADALGVKADNILMVVEVKDEVTMSRVLNKNLDTKNLYAIKLRQDSGGVGSNDWVIVNRKANGKFEQAMRQDPSDTMQDISQTVGLRNNNLQTPDLDPGDIDTVSRNGTRYTETSINGTRLNDEYGILETQKDYKTTVHIAREEDGKAELLCSDEHSEHEIKKVELPDRDVEIKEEEEEEDRTPGGEAYDRRFNRSH